MNTRLTKPELRLMEPSDIPAVLQLMSDSRFPISGVASKALYRAICRDSLKDDRLLIGVAEVDKTVAGFLLVIVDYAACWKRFLGRHPVLGLRMVWSRLRRRKRSADAWATLDREARRTIEHMIEPEPSGRSWSDSGPSIAKGVFLQVAPRFRRLGLAVVLYDYLFDVLRRRAVYRCDAKVDITNVGAHPLHLRMGYRLERQGNTLFATRDL